MEFDSESEWQAVDKEWQEYQERMEEIEKAITNSMLPINRLTGIRFPGALLCLVWLPDIERKLWDIKNVCYVNIIKIY